MSAADTYLVTLPPPTPNGGLHLGHVSGPFLAADVFVKAQALRGARCRTVTYADANQSYVRVTAERAGRDPDELARTFADDIRGTLALYGSQVDDFIYPEGEANRFVHDLLARMSETGALVRKPMPFFHSPSRGRILDEAGVSGFCPRCLAACKCGICEACAFPTAPGNLVAPRDAVSGDEALEIRSVEVLVLETERHRAAIRTFLDARPNLRPRYRWLMEEALAGPLPDFPVTVPGDWGIAAGAALPGQVINPWAEVMAQLLRLYRGAAAEGETPRVVNFYGFDNTYFYAVVHVALLAAAGEERWLPHVAVINEFYNLEHRKFSTSNNHVVWARDLAGRVAPDAVRFYAAFNTPGFEKGNFVEADMLAVLDDRITRPWSRLARRFNDGLVGEGRAAEASPETVALGRAALERVFASYALERFHLRQAAEDILHLLEFVEARLAAGRLGAADAAWMIAVLGQALLPIAPRAGEALYRRMTRRAPDGLDLSGLVAPQPLAETLF